MIIFIFFLLSIMTRNFILKMNEGNDRDSNSNPLHILYDVLPIELNSQTIILYIFVNQELIITTKHTIGTKIVVFLNSIILWGLEFFVTKFSFNF
jgi:hypothetical protein